MDYQTVWLYFFSTIFQGNMALLAFVGVFVVFRLQQIRADIQARESAIINFVHDSMVDPSGKHIPINYSGIENLELLLEELKAKGSTANIYAKDKATEILREKTVHDKFREYSELRTSTRTVIRSLWFPVVPNVMLCGFALYALPNYQTINNAMPCVITAAIGFNSLIIIINVGYMFWTLRESRGRAH